MNGGGRLLLDIDGVLIRDHVLLDHVKHNIIKYVNRKLPGTPPSAKINSLLYRAYGHTAKGLQKEFGIDTRDFDFYVYNPKVINHLYDFLDSSEEFHEDVKLLRKCGREIELFSNAPLAWSDAVREAIGLTERPSVYSKPDIESYLAVDNGEPVTFVDDKMCNLMPALFFPNWTPIHFSERKETEFIKTVTSINEIVAC